MEEDLYSAASQLQISTLDGQVAYLDNLSQHFKSDEFSDVTLVVGGKYFPAHKTILATASTYFQRMFYGGAWREGEREEVKLQEDEDCKQVFEMFLRYFYSGSVDVTEETVHSVLTLADKYDVQGLKDICSDFMVNLLGETPDYEIALEWVYFAKQMRLEVLQERCMDLICFNFDKVIRLDEAWCSLPLEILVTILKRSDLIVANEYVVYQAVQEWLLGVIRKENTPEITQHEVCSLLPHIQFKNMLVQHLCQVESNPLETHTSCKTDHQLHPYLFKAFRYIAIRDNFPEGCLQPAKIQRCYIASDDLNTVIFDWTNPNGCAALVPECSWSIESSKYQWELVKLENSSTLHIRLPQVSRSQYDPYGNRTSTSHLRSALLGTICLSMTLIFRNQNGCNLFFLKDSLGTKIPDERGVLLEIPEVHGASLECFPYDVQYVFIIEKV